MMVFPLFFLYNRGIVIGSPPRQEAKYTVECREKKMELICKKVLTDMLENCYVLDRQIR